MKRSGIAKYSTFLHTYRKGFAQTKVYQLKMKFIWSLFEIDFRKHVFPQSFRKEKDTIK